MRAVLLVSFAAWLLVTPVAAGRSTIAYPATTDTVSVTNTEDPALELHLDTFLAPNCTPPFCPDDRFELASAQRFREAPLTDRCEPVAGVTDDSQFSCSKPVPARVQVTSTAGADSIRATGAGRGTCAPLPMIVDALGGADTLAGTCAGDTLNGGDGNDSISAGDGANTVSGGPGDDALSTGDGGDVVAAGDGADAASSGGGIDNVDGGAGNDALSGGEGDDTLLGAADSDRLIAGPGADTLDGGDGADELRGEGGNDVLRGGAGRDLLLPGSGTDSVQGGDGGDTVSYEDQAGSVGVVLDGVANDGPPGEADAVGLDVENVVTGPGNDQVAGNGGPNDLQAGAGDDVVSGGGGTDFLDAGSGNDQVQARDGEQDRVDCGTGGDAVIADTFDVIVQCEAVDASRELMSDVDNDGVALPLDCDDRDPLRRPGLPDLPENGRNEDCVAGDARFPRVLATLTANFDAVRRRARVTRLVANDVPDTATVRITCSGRKCFRRAITRAFPNGKRRANLKRHVRRLRLRRGAVLEVRILREQTVGRVWTYKVGRRASVASQVRCLRPGAIRPGACPTS